MKRPQRTSLMVEGFLGTSAACFKVLSIRLLRPMPDLLDAISAISLRSLLRDNTKQFEPARIFANVPAQV